MPNKCSKTNEVFHFFNLMQDGRALTDYRSQSEVYNSINKQASNFCKSAENSYDTRICLQRNAGLIFTENKNTIDSTYNLPKCQKAKSSCNVLRK